MDITGVGAAADAIGEATESVRTAAARAGADVFELGRRARGAVDDRRIKVADGLESAAAGIQSSTESMRAGLAQVADQTAGHLDATAGYVRETTAREMLHDLEGFIKAHPMPVLLGAVCMGFVAGRTLRRD